MLAIWSVAPPPLWNLAYISGIFEHYFANMWNDCNCKVVWYFQPLTNFPQFVVIHTVKGFSVVNEAEVDIFLEFPCFLCDLVNVGNLTSDSSASSKPSLYIWSSQIMYRWSLAWRILSITLLACEMSAIVCKYSEGLREICLEKRGQVPQGMHLKLC